MVVRLGRPASSKVLAQWVAASGAVVVQVGGPGTTDPEHTIVAALDAAVLPALGTALRDVGDAGWRSRWLAAGTAATAAIERVLGPEAPLSEPAVARLVARSRPAGSHLVVAASMPMRDLEWFGGPRDPPTPTAAPTGSTVSRRPPSGWRCSPPSRPSCCSATSRSSTMPAR